VNWQIVIQKVVKYLLILALIGFASFYLYENADATFQNDSEGLAVGRIVAEQLGLEINTDGYGLGRLESTKNPYADVYAMIGDPGIVNAGYEYSAYASQVGLQGMVYSLVAKLTARLDVFLYLRFASCFFLTITIFGIVGQLYKRYGMLFASVFGIITFASPWIVNFSRNLYWVEFTWFLPMLIGLLWLNYEKKRKFIYPLFFVVIFIKCLCGYEYISTIMMSAILFLIVEWICNKEKRKTLTKGVFCVGVFCVLGFVMAMLVHAYIYADGHIVQGIAGILEDLVQRRTFGDAAAFDPAYAESLNASIFDVLKKYFWSAGEFMYGKRMLLLFIVAIIALIYQRIVLKEKNLFEISIFLISFLATVSWLVLGKAHSYIHTHMNFVMFYMGWAQISVYIICKAILEKKKIKMLTGSIIQEVE